MMNADAWHKLADERSAEIVRLRANQDALIAALGGMLNIFDREGSAPRKLASGEPCLSIGARECDSARTTLNRVCDSL